MTDDGATNSLGYSGRVIIKVHGEVGHLNQSLMNSRNIPRCVCVWGGGMMGKNKEHEQRHWGMNGHAHVGTSN